MFGFFAQRAVDVLASGASEVTWVTCCDGGPDAAAVAERLGCKVLSLERDGPRRRYGFGDVSQAAAVALGVGGVPPAHMALAYSVDEQLSRVADALGVRLAAATPSLKVQIDDKARTRRAFQELGLPALRMFVIELGNLNFDVAAARVGVPYVIQPTVGSSGLDTTKVNSPDEHDAAIQAWRSPCHAALVTAWGGAASLNVHGVASSYGVHVSAPSVQVTGVSALGAAHNEYCGNDWSAAGEYETSLLDDAAAQTVTIGRWLTSIGYTGMFGVDFVIADGRAVALEVNPRMQGSSWALPDIESRAGHPRTCEAHAAAFIGRPCLPAQAPSGVFRGAQLVMRACAEGRAPFPGPRSGVYRVESGGRLRHVQPGVAPSDCGPEEVLVGGLPASGAHVADGAVICRLFSWQQLARSDGRELTPLGRLLAYWAGASMMIVP